MASQEMFDVMVRGLAAQAWQQSTYGERCVYRGPNGMKCAIGHLMPDGPACNFSGSVSKLLREHPMALGFKVNRQNEITFLMNAQQAHDSEREPDRMKSRFGELAKFYDLAWPAEVPQ